MALYRDMQDRIVANSEPDPSTDTGNGPCWLWTARTTRGKGGSPRPRINVRANGKHRQAFAYRVAYEAFHGPIPPGYEVNHMCECTICVNPSHLEAVTHSVNMVQENARRKRRK